MRIILLMDPFIPVPPTHYGGIERVVSDLASRYVKMGHSVTLIAGPNSLSPDKLIVYGENGILSKKIDLKILFEVYKILSREIKIHDVIHNFGRLIFLAPFLKHKIRKVQTYMRYVNQKNIQKYDLLRPNNLVYTAVSDAIANTGKTKNSIWKTVYNCAPVEKYTFNPHVPEGSYLVFLGRLERCKGVHNAIAVAKSTNRQLVIAGNISNIEDEIIYFQQEVQPLIDGIQIKYIGAVDDEQKNSLLRNASALLTPIEWFEPFPIIIPEAYACGTPVLGFRNGGVPEGIIHGTTGFISETTAQMAEHVEKIESLSREKCREMAETTYSDKQIANAYLTLYETNG